MKWCLLVIFVMFSLIPLSAQEQNPPAEQQTTPPSTQAQPTDQPPGETQDLTLNDAIDLALKNNLSLEIQRYNPEIEDTLIANESAKFQPLFTSNMNVLDQNFPTSSALVGANRVLNKSFVYDFLFQHLLRTGTSYTVRFNNERFRTDQFFNTINPRYDTSLFANVTQPLLRNFGKDITLTPLQIAQKNRLTSDYQLQQRVGDTALLVEQTYWNLAFARGELDVATQSLASAKDLYENNRKQVEVGTMAPLEVVVAEAEVAAREQDIITAETAIANIEQRLKTLIYGNIDAPERDQALIPKDEPQIVAPEYGEDELIQRALAENPDLKAFQADLESKSLSKRLAQNQLKPQLDLQGSLGATGLGGTRLIFGGDDPFNPIIIDTIPGGYGDSLSSLFDHRTWSVGFVFGLPIGNGTAKADYARAGLSEQQAAKSLEDAKEQLILNIRTYLQNLKSDLKHLDAAKASLALQQKKLDAEQKKLAVGLSTNHVVLDFQKDLAQAQSDVLLAIVNYSKDKAQLKRYLGISVGR